MVSSFCFSLFPLQNVAYDVIPVLESGFDVVRNVFGFTLRTNAIYTRPRIAAPVLVISLVVTWQGKRSPPFVISKLVKPRSPLSKKKQLQATLDTEQTAKVYKDAAKKYIPAFVQFVNGQFTFYSCFPFCLLACSSIDSLLLLFLLMCRSFHAELASALRHATRFVRIRAAL